MFDRDMNGCINWPSSLFLWLWAGVVFGIPLFVLLAVLRWSWFWLFGG
jgi:hypothetical protein